MAATRGDVVRLTDDPGFDDSPALSPDGTQIAFLRARHDPSWIIFQTARDGDFELYVMRADGSDPHPLAAQSADVRIDRPCAAHLAHDAPADGVRPKPCPLPAPPSSSGPGPHYSEREASIRSITSCPMAIVSPSLPGISVVMRTK